MNCIKLNLLNKFEGDGVKDFRDMSVWQKALRLLVKIYKITRTFPEEKFGMVSDMRRAANSIIHDIAEGCGRFSPKDKSRFYIISRGSCFELISRILASFELKFISEISTSEELISDTEDIINELNPLIKSVESRLIGKG